MDWPTHIRDKRPAPSATDPLNGHSEQGTSSSSLTSLRHCRPRARGDRAAEGLILAAHLACRVRRWAESGVVGSPQALGEHERRVVAAWAADCAERVLELFESSSPGDPRPRDAIARTRAFARGELDGAEEIRRRFAAAGAARVADPAAAAAARAAGQASAVARMGAHALGAAAYAARAVELAEPHRPAAASEEICWQLSIISAEVRAALRQLPPVGEDKSGPLGPGLLASGRLGAIIHDLQADLATPRKTEPGHHDQQHAPQRN